MLQQTGTGQDVGSPRLKSLLMPVKWVTFHSGWTAELLGSIPTSTTGFLYKQEPPYKLINAPCLRFPICRRGAMLPGGTVVQSLMFAWGFETLR